jgi:hypothetical protein
MANLTRADILARKTGRGIATLPSGGTVAIRALTRNEVLDAQQTTASIGEKDTLFISLAMTDPVMSIEDVQAWADSAAAGDLVAVSEAIAVLSGLKESSGKDAYKSAGKRSGS